MTPDDPSDRPRPPVDLDKPVENPDLVARLIQWRASSGSKTDTRDALQMVRDAVFLMATRITHPDGEPAIVDGTMRTGTRIDLYTIRLPDDRMALAVFTDWPSLRAAVGGGPEWSSLVEAGESIMKMGLGPEYLGGVVINPSGPEVSLGMDPEQIAWMYANTRPRDQPPVDEQA